jgi:hypothetical protein
LKVIVDRIEEEIAVCEQENRQMINIPLKDISFIPKEGDVLIIDKNNIKLDLEETKNKKGEIENLTKDLWG